jgi:glucose/arabinose dehydrogenase
MHGTAYGARRIALILLFSWILSAAAATAATLPAGFTETRVAAGLSSPTAMTFAPDGRLFVAQQNGQLRVIKNGALLSAPFLTATVSSSGERGLLGVAFDPNFAANQFVYVYYTATSPTIHNRVSRFTASGDTAVPGSETVLLDLETSQDEIHNGGALHFGPDGKLYIAVGDDGITTNAQSMTVRRGKILRINSDGSIPTDNPFFGTATGVYRAIWALGLRNPYTFAFQRGTTRMFINDVGEADWEEINDGIAGSNYGWPTTEGPTSDPRFRGPIHAYGHGPGDTLGCAISGGGFYNPVAEQFPADYRGKYFFADYCSGWIRRFDPANGTATGFATGIDSPVDLAVASDGSLYYLARDPGSVYRVNYTASNAARITTQPANQTVTAGQTATFSVTASGAAPLSFQWRKNGVNLSGATSASYTTPATTLADNGALYSVVVSNSFGSDTSDNATLTVTSNNAPTPTITAPANNTLYNAGDIINYSGTGTDPEDGTLPASAFTWQVDFHHDTHIHPFVAPTTGATGGSFTIPRTGHTESNVWYRIYLTVRDSGGLTRQTFVDVVPRKVTLTLASSPSGLQLTLDGQPVTTPHSFQAVVGVTRTLGAVSPQTLGGTAYQFQSWSDGAAATHTFNTPASNTTYTAAYIPTGTPPPTGNGLSATYFDNLDFTGATVSRIDPTVNFDWDIGSPAPGIDVNTFSARWTGQVEAAVTGTHTFYTLSDDGVRLWVDNVLVVNNWTNHGPTENSGTINLTAGQRYDIKMEYYEDAHGAVATLSWSAPGLAKQIVPQARLFPTSTPPPPPPPPTGTGLSATYYDNLDLTAATVSRIDPNINFDWGTGSPAPGIADSTFSVRWTGQIEATVTGTHTFYTMSDDGVRLWINNVLVVNNWTDHAPTENSGTINLTAGQRYDLKMEFYDNVFSAVAQLSWSAPGLAKQIVPQARLFPTAGTPPTSAPGLTATYYDNLDFTGATVSRIDSTVNFDWDTGSPAPGIDVNTFSARWTGKIKAKVAGTQTFYTVSDDGVRLWVNGALVINNWTDHPPTENSGTLYLDLGQTVDIRMEFYENSHGAQAKLLWSAPGLAKEVVPASQLSH